MMPRLTEADIKKYIALNGSHGPWENLEWLATLLDLQETRQDLRDLYFLSSGETPMGLESFRERLKQKYGWKEGEEWSQADFMN